MVYAISDVLSKDARKITYNTLKVEKPRPAVTDAHTPPGHCQENGLLDRSGSA
jgi:hypothetical protein